MWFSEVFFEKQKNIFTIIRSPWYNGVERVIFPKNEISRHWRQVRLCGNI